MQWSPETLGLVVGVGAIALVRLLRPRKRRRRVSKSEQANVRAGQVGEDRTARIFRQYGLNVWPNVRVASGHRTSQCDQIVFGQCGIVVVETKHWTGTLQRLNANQWAQVKPDGTRRVYDSPKSQNAYHCQVVREVLRSHGMGRVPVVGAIVLSNRNAVFVSGPGSQPIGSPEAIAQWIQQLPAARNLPQADRVEGLLRSSGAGVSRTVPWG